MSENKALNYSPSGFFALRTPLLPLAEWLAWSNDLAAPAALGDEAQLSAALARDRALLRARLRDFLARPEVWDAFFVAAPNLDERLSLWLTEPDSPRGQKLEHVLTRYFGRMAARPTPFGLFAGCSVGPLGTETRLACAHRREAQRHTRLDADYLFALVEKLKDDSRLQDELRYRPNSSLYRAAGRVRYVEARLNGKNRSYHLVALDDTPYLAATLERARDGVRAGVLAEALVNANIAYEQARKYIGDLIAAQVLTPDLPLTVTGPEAIHPLIEELARHNTTRAAAEVLAATRDALAALDRESVGVPAARYRAIAQQLEQLPAPVELARLFQVDMVKPAPDAVLGTKVVNEIVRGLRLLQRRAQSVPPEALKRFAEKFAARYEGREVPLLEALDEEIGIGFDAGTETAPLLKGLGFPAQNGAVGGRFNAFDAFLLNKLAGVWQSGATELVLEEKDWEKFAAAEPARLPDALGVTAVLAAAGPEALARGDFQIYWHTLSGPSGARLLGRFCHADSNLQRYVEEHLRAEEAHRPDTIHAEVVHLPAGRMGNILARPVLRAYEIAYLGCSGAHGDRQIPVTDLLVSVHHGRVRLRSARLAREIVPRMTNAHNYWTYGLGVYRFLCLLQDQDAATGMAWNWGALENAPFLPRVRVGRLVLAHAQWNVSRDELSKFGKLTGTGLFRAVQEWRAQRRLPRLVNLADGDNILPVDLDNVLSVEAFVQMVHTRASAILNEFFPAPDQLCAVGPEGLFTHELLVPFVKHHAAAPEKSASTTPLPALQAVPARRSDSFLPGSAWLYAKLYTGTATADRLLKGMAQEVTREVLSREAARQWFFIRYSDPEWHVRLRFQGTPELLRSVVQPALEAAWRPWLERGALWRVQYDTYTRETERYGGPVGVELSERLFHADSEAVLNIITMLEPGDAGLDERWRLTCAGMDLLLTDFGLDLEEKHALLRGIRDGFAREVKADNSFHGRLGDKFRKERAALAELLAYPESHPLAPGIEVFRERSAALAPVARELRAAEQDGELTQPVNHLLGSYLHMHANRLLRSAQRQQELVIYDLLTRHYDSLRARARSVKRAPEPATITV